MSERETTMPLAPAGALPTEAQRHEEGNHRDFAELTRSAFLRAGRDDRRFASGSGRVAAMDVYVALPTDSRRRHLAATNDLFRGMKELAQHWRAVVSPRYNIVQKLCHCFAGAIGGTLHPCSKRRAGRRFRRVDCKNVTKKVLTNDVPGSRIPALLIVLFCGLQPSCLHYGDNR
jgi:hypothetical protein